MPSAYSTRTPSPTRRRCLLACSQVRWLHKGASPSCDVVIGVGPNDGQRAQLVARQRQQLTSVLQQDDPFGGDLSRELARAPRQAMELI